MNLCEVSLCPECNSKRMHWEWKLREGSFQIDLYVDSDEKVLLARFLQMLLQFSFVHGQSVLMPLLTSVKHIKIFPRDLDSYTMFT